MTRANIAFLAIALLAANARAEEPAISLSCTEPWSNVFAETNVTFHVRVDTKQALNGRLTWRFSSNRRTIAAGDLLVSAGPAAPATATVELRVPTVRPGVIVRSMFTASVFLDGNPDAAASLEKVIWIFPGDPFRDKREWLKKLNIHLFDPEQTMSTLLTSAGVAFRTVKNIDDATDIDQGMLIVAEGVSLRDYRGLGETVLSVAASGTPVLCMAFVGGELPLPGKAREDLPLPSLISLRRNDIIPQLDKRLDADHWMPDGRAVTSSIALVGERGPVTCVVHEDASAWPWIEMTLGPNHTKLVLCGFAIADKWADSPTPRYLLGAILKHIAVKQQQDKKEESHEE